MSEPLNLYDTSIAFKDYSTKELKKIAFLFSLMNNPVLSKIGPLLIKTGLALRLPINNILRKTLFGHFCGGESLIGCHQKVEKLYKHLVGSILNYSVEGEYSNKSFDQAADEIQNSIRFAKNKASIPFAVFKPTALVSYEILNKIQLKSELSESEKNDWIKARERYDRICREAYIMNVPVFIDAEKTWFQNPIDDLALEMMKKYNQSKCIVYTTIQFYRKDSIQLLNTLIEEARKGSFFTGVKMVRGAYLDEENERSKKFNYSTPLHSSKKYTDSSFNDALEIICKNKDVISACVASHNEESCMLMAQRMTHHQIHRQDKHIYFSQLLGMSDHITFNLAKDGYNSTKYMPYGPVESVLPYLFRRAEENRSISGQTGRELIMIRREIERRGR